MRSSLRRREEKRKMDKEKAEVGTPPPSDSSIPPLSIRDKNLLYLMEKYGLSLEHLLEKLSEKVDSKDERVSSRYLAIALNVWFPSVPYVRKLQSKKYGLGAEAMTAEKVVQKIREAGGDAETTITELLGEMNGADRENLPPVRNVPQPGSDVSAPRADE
jgi:hypothetical protein